MHLLNGASENKQMRLPGLRGVATVRMGCCYRQEVQREYGGGAGGKADGWRGWSREEAGIVGRRRI